MAKAKYVNDIGMLDSPNIDINLQQEEEIFNPDLLLRSFGISDDYGGSTELSDVSILQSVMMEQSQVQKPQSVIMKNNQTVNTGSQSSHISVVAQDNFLSSPAQPL